MKDLIGIERGKCLNELTAVKTPCPCPKYKIDEGATRGACNLCECPSVVHEEILETASSDTPLSTSLGNTSATSSASDNSVIVIDIPSSSCLADLMNAPSISREPTSFEIEGMFPKILPTKLQAAIDAKKLDANHKNALISKVVTRLHEDGHASNSELKKAARRMLKKWSPMKNSLAPDDSTSLYNQLRKKRDKLNVKGSKTKANTSNSLEEMTPQNAKNKLYNLWLQGNRNVSEYKLWIPHVRPMFKSDAKKSPGLVLLKQYPYLEMKDLLLHELAGEAKMSIENMERNWSITVPLLIEYLKAEKVECSDSGLIANKTLSILENLHKVPLWFRKKNEDNNVIKLLEIHPVDKVLREIQPGPRDPPRLIALGKLDDGNLTIYCYLDSTPFFTEEDPLKALLLLLSAYFVIGIRWPTHTRLPLILLTCATMGAQIVASDIARNNKLIDILKNLKLM